MRDPAALIETWPQLWEVMAQVRQVIAEARQETAELRGLTKACGSEPERQPPETLAVARLRSRIGELFGLAPEDVEQHHPASPWRFKLVQKVQAATSDPYLALGTWLEEGAPMGITRPIAPGGLFPAVDEAAGTSLEELDALERWTCNHPSFGETFGEDEPPGVNKGV